MKTANATLAALKSLVKNNTRIYLHGIADPSRESYSDAFLFEVSGKNAPNEDLAVKLNNVKGRVTNGYTSVQSSHQYDGKTILEYDRESAYRTARGYWGSLNESLVRTAVNHMPKHLEPRFFIYLDAGTNQNLIEAKMHADHLYLQGYDTEKSVIAYEALLDVEVGPHNTARWGTPDNESDTKGRSEW